MRKKINGVDDDLYWLDYAEFWPSYGEEGYDPNKQGVKGIKKDAPQWAKEKYERYKEDERTGYRR